MSMYSNKLEDFLDFLKKELGEDIVQELKNKYSQHEEPVTGECQEIVICADFGGFSLSKHVFDFFKKNNHSVDDRYGIKRDDPVLVNAVKLLGKKANGPYAELEIVKVPKGVEWVIDEYDGMETVQEAHRSWS